MQTPRTKRNPHHEKKNLKKNSNSRSIKNDAHQAMIHFYQQTFPAETSKNQSNVEPSQQSYTKAFSIEKETSKGMPPKTIGLTPKREPVKHDQ